MYFPLANHQKSGTTFRPQRIMKRPLKLADCKLWFLVGGETGNLTFLAHNSYISRCMLINLPAGLWTKSILSKTIIHAWNMLQQSERKCILSEVHIRVKHSFLIASHWSPTVQRSMEDSVEDSKAELVLFKCSQCYVYAPIPAAGTLGHRAESWDVDNWMKVSSNHSLQLGQITSMIICWLAATWPQSWRNLFWQLASWTILFLSETSVRVVACGDNLSIRLTDVESGGYLRFQMNLVAWHIGKDSVPMITSAVCSSDCFGFAGEAFAESPVPNNLPAQTVSCFLWGDWVIVKLIVGAQAKISKWLIAAIW